MVFVLGQIFNNRELCGYRLLSTGDRSVTDVNLETIREVYTKRPPNSPDPIENAKYKEDSGILIGTQGSLTEYQRIGSNGVLLGKKCIMICYEIIDVDTGKLGGYGVCDGYGMIINVVPSKLLELCSKYKPSNFSITPVSGGKIKVKSLGKAFKKYAMQTQNVRKGYNSKLGEKDTNVPSNKSDKCGEIKVTGYRNKLPVLNIYSYSDIKASEFAQPAQEKLFKAYLNMKKISLYYHTLLMSIKREATLSVSTLAVTEDTMYYNLEFISRLSVAEVTFILIHEICHIAMRHSIRHGKKNNYLWNIATDLYINSIISRDFGCYHGQGEVEIDTPLGKGVIKVPDQGVHLSTIGETLDFGLDTPESIYWKLYKENPPQQGQGQGQQGQGQQGQGQGQSQQGQSQQGQGQDQEGQPQDQEGQGNGQDDSLMNGKSVNSSKSDLDNECDNVDESGIYSRIQEVTITYNGKKLTGKVPMDVMTSEAGDSKDREDRMAEKSAQAIQGMKTAVEVKEEKLGTPLTKKAGSGSGIIRRCIDFGLSNTVNWRVYLRNMCTSKPKKIYTLGSPNEVYMNAGVTVASRRKFGKPTEIKGIKIGIDVSGSVGEEELNYYLSEINNILQSYKVDGELIYWSTIVGDAGKFSDLKDMLKVDPKSTGGTDVKCLFDYLARKTRVNGKYEETPLKDISCILIFTDGCFGNNYEEYAKLFGKKVIWVIPDSKFMFEPPFGKIAVMDIYE